MIVVGLQACVFLLENCKAIEYSGYGRECQCTGISPTGSGGVDGRVVVGGTVGGGAIGGPVL